MAKLPTPRTTEHAIAEFSETELEARTMWQTAASMWREVCRAKWQGGRQ